MALRLVMTAILGVNLGRLGPLLMLQDAPVAAAFDTAQTQAAARLVLVQYELGFTVALVFFGVDCLVVGWMVIRSAFLPAPLELMLVAAGVCYLTASVADLVFPAFVQPFDVLMVAYAAELALCFWLIVMSVNPELSRGRADAGGWCRSRRAHPAHAAGRVADPGVPVRTSSAWCLARTRRRASSSTLMVTAGSTPPATTATASPWRWPWRGTSRSLSTSRHARWCS
jgi:hypothetical protein